MSSPTEAVDPAAAGFRAPLSAEREASGQSVWSGAVATPAFQDLLKLKRRAIGPMLVGGLAFFIAIMALAGFARPFMAQRVAGSLNVGYALIIATYVMCWALAALYAVLANARFDPQASRAAAVFDHEERHS